jgi:hypothetical protein
LTPYQLLPDTERMNPTDSFRIMSQETAGRLLCALAIFAACAMTGGCATLIDEHKPAPNGWPTLQVRDHVVSGWEVQRQCYEFLPLTQKLLGGFPMACAKIDFLANSCDIYHAHDATPEVLEHEQMHCRGHSHVGDTWAEDALRGWHAYLAGQAVAKAAQ